ncbi:hypothetical protein BJY04DRAFT_224688 [Aspergillus karnatakaensis]|uniref:putative DNA damage repair protein Mus42 n=1 Tax=Aspergillus karnatakaensis TaxID=1810916 RepID=UPI003CCE430C
MGSRLDATSSAVRKRIQDHSFNNEEGEEYGPSAFGGHGDYMRRKKAKLQNLDNDLRTSAARDNCPPIFRSVVACVNGYTQPSLSDLHKLIVRHGGGFLQYLDGKTSATHIIASSLTPKKREEFRRYRVVKPAWVVDSVNAGRLLPWDLYKVVDEGRSQKVLNFDNGLMVSQTNSPRPSYRDQSKASWYSSRLQVDDPFKDGAVGPLEPSSTKLSNGTSQSDYGDFPSFTSLDVPAQDTTRRQSLVPDEVKEVESLPTTPTPFTPTKLDRTTPIDTISPPNSDSKRLPTTPSSFQLPRTPTKNGVSSPQNVPTPPKPEMTSEEYNAQLLADPRMRTSSVVNPEFLQQYYRESRLHHLSTWKAELKAQLQSSVQEKTRSQAARRRLVPGARRYIIHVDFDCFFAAVSTLKHPELEGKPVAIAHGTGTGSEIASCNYAARSFGVKNGMWMKGALQACPDLRVLPYDFPAYEEASRKFYRAILAIDGLVQSVSIDEALVDVTSLCLEAGGSDGKGVSEGSIYREQAKADEIAESLRASVKSETGCAVSVGIGGNILQAKVALREAKPAGQFQLKPEAVLDFIGELPVQNLPGVGYSMSTKLEELGVKIVKDIRDLSREKLSSSLGPKTGVKLWDYARGIDRTEVGNEVVRKSVSAEVNWGIRFVTQDQAEDFMRSLCEELHRRLVENLVRGKQLTLKVMRRRLDAPLEPVKHLGHGKCDVFNKSVVLGIATNASDVLGKEAVAMLRSLGISPGDLRGLGVQMTRLEPLKSTADKPDGSQKQLAFKASPARKSTQPRDDPDLLDSPRKAGADSIVRGAVSSDSTQRPLNISGTQFIMPSQPDPAVVAELPPDIRSKLITQGKARNDTRTGSPFAPGPRPQPSTSTLPPPSQLDPETLAALPEDVLAEVLGYYDQQPVPTNTHLTTASSSSSTIPQPPAPAPRPSTSTSTSTLKVRKPTTPQKKRRGRPPLKPPPPSSLTQSKFAFPRLATIRNPHTPANPNPSPNTDPEPATDLDPDTTSFLAALPPDIRAEVLEDQKRARALHRPTTRHIHSNANERKLALPALPARPVFTSKRLSDFGDLRDEASAWHEAFADEGPFREDVEALAVYLRRVVVEERDVEKAVGVIRWIGWLVEDGKGVGEKEEVLESVEGRVEGSQGAISWDEALGILKGGVEEGLEERGMPGVDFD